MDNLLKLYILNDNNEPIRAKSTDEWTMWMGFGNGVTKRRVALTKLGEAEVSTVFLGLDHRFLGRGAPILFESMIFCDDPHDPLNYSMERYCTWEEAERGHAALVEELQVELALSATLTQDALSRIKLKLEENNG